MPISLVLLNGCKQTKIHLEIKEDMTSTLLTYKTDEKLKNNWNEHIQTTYSSIQK